MIKSNQILSYFRGRGLWLLFLVMIGAFVYRVYAVYSIKKQYAAVDLRNRLVGSRILEHKQQASPYYYKWKKEDGDSYLDLYDTPYAAVNRNTVTPFFLQLLFPFNDYPFTAISWVWFIAEIAAIILACLLFAYAYKDYHKSFWIFFCGLIAVGCSQGFAFHAVVGQVYIFYGLMLCIIFLLFNRTDYLSGILISLLLLLLILTRPIAVVFLLPFIIKRKWKILVVLAVLISGYFSYEFITQGNLVWAQYLKAMQEWGLDFPNGVIPASYEDLHYAKTIEGSSVINTSLIWHISEDTSARGWIFRFLHIKLYPNQLMLMAAVISLILLFYFRKKLYKADYRAIFIFSFLLYIIAEIFLPAIRNSYNAVQWIFPLLIVVTTSKLSARYYIAIVLGTILCIGLLKFLPFDLFLGELIFAAICFIYINTRPINA